MKRISKCFYRILLLFSLPFITMSSGALFLMLKGGRVYLSINNFFLFQENIFIFNAKIFFIGLLVDIFSNGFKLNIDDMSDDELKSGYYSMLWSLLGTILIVFFILFTNIENIIFVFFIIFVHLFSIVELSKFYIRGTYKNANIFKKNNKNN